MAITSGADKIVSHDQMKNLAPEGEQVHQVIVAGVDHHPTKDPNWYNVLPRIEKNIVDFIDTCGEEHWTKESVVDELVDILYEIEYFKNLTKKFTQTNIDKDPSLVFDLDELDRLVLEVEKCKGEKAKYDFIKFYYISKAYYPGFEELIIKIARIYDQAS